MARARKATARAASDAVATFPGVIVIDTREQRPFAFDSERADVSQGAGIISVPTRVGTLSSGDYSLEGFETRVAVERKSASDLYSTIGGNRDRFERELERLAAFDFAAVVVEAEWSELVNSPPRHTQTTPKTIVRSVLAWQQRYPRVHWWACANRAMAETITFRILERFLKEETKRLEGADK